MFGALRRVLRAIIALPRPVRRLIAGPPVHRDGFRATAVATGGDSAGANLALTAAHQLARRRGESPAFVLAMYPVTDAGRAGGSRGLFAEGFGLRTAHIEVFERY